MPAATPDPSQEFSIAVTPDRAEVAVVPIGELDVSTIDAVELEVREAGFTLIVVDLRRVTFMDSTGLQLLISLRNVASRMGHRLTLKPGPRQVRRLFDITGTRSLFDWRLGHTPTPLGAPTHRPTAA